MTDWMTEEALAKTLGVDREVVKRERPYAGTGGVRVNGKAIEWSAEAATALAVKLGINDLIFQKNAPPAAVAPSAGPEKNAAPADGIETLTVASAPACNGRHFANPNIIKARRDNGEVVCVRVMDSGKYQPTLWNSKEPMTIKAKKSPGGNWWELIGREPRWRGRF